MHRSSGFHRSAGCNGCSKRDRAQHLQSIHCIRFIWGPLFDCCLLRFDAAEPRVIAARLQRDDSRLIAQVTPIPAVLAGERRNERAMRLTRALLDLVAAIVARGPFAFGGLAMKLE